MSTASLVPETYELTGDDAWETLRRHGTKRLVGDAFQRLRSADGFSHARALAFMTSLVVVQGVIALVGLAVALGQHGFSDAVGRAIKTATPGPAGETIASAISQAQGAGFAHRYLALAVGLVGSLITGTSAMGQLERGLNRIYGVEKDRPALEKYALALRLTLTAGFLLVVSFAVIAFGHELGRSPGSGALDTVWRVLSWPLAIVAITGAFTMLFQRCPRRHQPQPSWLAFGAGISVALWFAVTLALGAFFRFSSTFGQTYGPLAGIVALQLWTLLSAIAILCGAAVAAQLEAVRAGRSAPQDTVKVAESEPTARAAVPAGR